MAPCPPLKTLWAAAAGCNSRDSEIDGWHPVHPSKASGQPRVFGQLQEVQRASLYTHCHPFLATSKLWMAPPPVGSRTCLPVRIMAIAYLVLGLFSSRTCQLFFRHSFPDGIWCTTWMRPNRRDDHTAEPHAGHVWRCYRVFALMAPARTYNYDILFLVQKGVGGTRALAHSITCARLYFSIFIGSILYQNLCNWKLLSEFTDIDIEDPLEPLYSL